jgi:broad specificity phosphatase PhoE
MSSSTHLYLLRHGEVETRYHRVFGGQIDMDLSPLGHEQAKALARYLRKTSFDAIYASPMKRAQQTLAPLIEAYEKQAKTMADLCEVHFGDWTGLTWQQVHDKYQIRAFHWLEAMEMAKVPNGECGAKFRARIEPCLKQILDAHAGQKIAIVCHGGVIRMILSILLHLPLPKTAHFEIEYASVTKVSVSPEKTVLELMNFTPWRDLP